MLLLDTCALIWWTLSPEKLSAPASTAVKRAETEGACISSISVWEVGIKVKKRKLDIGTTLEEFVVRLRKIDFLEIVPVDTAIWVESVKFNWIHPDPADRVIVATASIRAIPIITSDAEIRAFYPDSIW